MSKKPIIGGIILVVILGMVAVGAQINPEYTEESSGSEVWQTRIAGPEYDNITKHKMDLGSLEGGTYKIEFVPMGDSPRKMKIMIVGELPADQKYYIEGEVYSSLFVEIFSEEFILEKNFGGHWNFKILYLGICWSEVCPDPRIGRRGKLQNYNNPRGKFARFCKYIIIKGGYKHLIRIMLA